ncbi:hypothetical protein FQK07_08525 [Synechococcus sp. BSF8S]|nr:hypothetical protein [Synechococcus sp. BSF8S]MBC1264218.1 hypothetical protein [Synechococcus sp. BSA11S]
MDAALPGGGGGGGGAAARHADGYVAYPLGIHGVAVGQGDTYDEALEDVRSAIALPPWPQRRQAGVSAPPFAFQSSRRSRREASTSLRK